ncbi:MAG: family 43 glycosylhydrolase [Cytophagaceae bacterium]|nr:family 43 glycosylhydrolase [Cytophagaceae bacterium]
MDTTKDHQLFKGSIIPNSIILTIDGIYMLQQMMAKMTTTECVIASENESINSNFIYLGKLTDKSDKWAIDGSPFIFNGKMYYVWSGWDGDVNVQQNIYIAENG